jgi:Domain of unknown function (DUF4124)
MKNYPMKICTLGALFVLAFAPSTYAQAYKCKQANGTVSFQDQPCAKGADGGAVKLPPPEDTSSVALNARAQKQAETQKILGTGDASRSSYDESRRRADEAEYRAKIAKNDAYNKNLRCNYARRQLGIVKEQTPIFSRDNKGERQYVKDEDRQGVIARAQKTVDEECN